MPHDWFRIAAADTAALAAHLSQEKAIWLGASGGGIVALLAAIHFPGRVCAVIADSTPERFNAQSLEIILAERAQRIEGQNNFWLSAQGENWQQVIDADMEFLCGLASCTVDLYDSRLNEIACPALFTASLQDGIIPDVGGQVLKNAAQVGGSQVFFANQGGDPLMWSNPSLFRQVSDLFLASLPVEGENV